MLRIYSVMLETVSRIRTSLGLIERKDPDLARQLRRASSSFVLNTGEGMYSRGRNRGARYSTALGSAREALSCLEYAQAMFGIPLDTAVAKDLDRIIATLVKLTA